MELSFSLTIHASSEEVWAYYADLSKWAEWEKELEDITLEGAFETGTTGTMTLSGMPPMAIQLTSVVENKEFIDVTETPAGPVTFAHYLQDLPEGVEIRHSVSMASDNQALLPMLTGIFSDVPDTMFLLKKVVENSGV